MSFTIGRYFFMISTTLNPLPRFGRANIGYAIEVYLSALFISVTWQRPIGIRGLVK